MNFWQAIWPYSGHYHPTEENFKEFISFLTEQRVNLSDVKVQFVVSFSTISREKTWHSFVENPKFMISFQKYSIDDDEFPSFSECKSMTEEKVGPADTKELNESVGEESQSCEDSRSVGPTLGIGGPMLRQWNTGLGPRIGCVRDYPVDLQVMALEKVNLSPRTQSTQAGIKGPIPSPRPGPRMMLSPRISQMGIPSPRVFLSLPKPKHRVEDISVPRPTVSLCLPTSKSPLKNASILSPSP